MGQGALAPSAERRPVLQLGHKAICPAVPGRGPRGLAWMLTEKM